MAQWACLLLTAAAPVQAQQVYKLQVASAGGSNTIIPLPIPIPIDTSRQEWLVIQVDGQKVKIRHTTSIANFVGLRTWHDHPATMIRLCDGNGFELKNCKTTQGDTATLPKGKSIYDVVIDFKYVEGGLTLNKTFQLSPHLKPN
jgi:hypothetical protein